MQVYNKRDGSSAVPLLVSTFTYFSPCMINVDVSEINMY